MSQPDNRLAGIPIIISKHVRPNEMLLIQRGAKAETVVHEGPSAGQTREQWITEPRIVRVVNLGGSDGNE